MTGPTMAAKASSSAELGQRRSSASSRVRSEVLGMELGLKERGGSNEGAFAGEGPNTEAGPRRSSAPRVKTDVLNVELGSNSRSLGAAKKGSGGEVGQARSSTVGTHGGDVPSLRQAELTQRLQHLEIQSMMRKEAPSAPPVPKSLPLDPSCLMTPPNTPLGSAEPTGRDPAPAHRVALASYSTTEGEYETVELPMTAATTTTATAAAGGFDGAKVAEVTAASPAVQSHNDEEEEEGDDEVFVVELSKGQKGLGMGLIDGMYTRLRVPGIYIKTLVPDTPAARCRRLSAGDRILAVNGTTLAGVDYQSAMDMIRSSGDGVRLLIAKVEKKQKQSTRL